MRINTGDIFFADFNLDKESRRKLINSGYEQTIRYFKETLPKKKELLEKIYTKTYNYMKKVYAGVKSNDVESVQWWLGDLFILLCENKELLDERIYNSIVNLKNNLMSSVKVSFLWRTGFKDNKILVQETKTVLNIIDERIADLTLAIQKLK